MTFDVFNKLYDTFYGRSSATAPPYWELRNSPASMLYSTTQEDTSLAWAGTHRMRVNGDMGWEPSIVRQWKCIM
ncbi:hypothetical protein DPMN_086210 [Dreissena polymorpha]|uniref:Uncharacterized protein n=1 Tax=Dreissena polymorpha TaxID=45954 RepID=A0A9D4BKY6_DREPO|nr:hypothetical protein DPMN_086210 [Dreissena polymorpha]